MTITKLTPETPTAPGTPRTGSNRSVVLGACGTRGLCSIVLGCGDLVGRVTVPGDHGAPGVHGVSL